MNSLNNRILIIIEEVGNIKVSAAIANWNLAKIIGENYKNVDILTLDNIAPDVKKEWSYGEVFVHKYENLKKHQTFILNNLKHLNTIIQIFRGNDFNHYNRIKNIRLFLNKNKNKYNSLLCLSGGLGFATHQAISNIKFNSDISLAGVFHDPYPSSSYPEPYKGGNRIYEYFKRKNLQKVISNLNHVIFPSQKLYEWYLHDYKIEAKKAAIVPHAVDFKLQIGETEKNNEIVRITHAGTLLKPRNPTVFLNTFIENSDKRLFVDFYGPVNKEVYKDILCFKDEKNIHISNERFSYQFAHQKLLASDFLLLIESDAVDNPFLPTKFVEYVVIGKPILVLTSPNSEVSRLLGDSYPFISELNNSDKISEILKEKIKNKKCLNDAKIILDGLKDYFSEANIISSYKSILN